MLKKLMVAGALAGATVALGASAASAASAHSAADYPSVRVGVYPTLLEARQACFEGLHAKTWSLCQYREQKYSGFTELWVTYEDGLQPTPDVPGTTV